MTEHIDLQHKLVNDVYAELGTISKHSQDVIDYLVRHGWIRTPAEVEDAARGEVPGRTITESDFKRAARSNQIGDSFGCYRGFLEALGFTVVPDPEPTNAEKLEKIIWASDGPVASISLARAELLAKWLDEAGVKAPTNQEES